MPTTVTMSRYYASPLWPCNAATADVAPHYVPTNQRSPHVALAMPYSANLRSDQSAFATRRSGNAVLRQFPLQPISIRHTPFWQCRTLPFAFPPISARYAPHSYVARYPFVPRRAPPHGIKLWKSFAALVSSKSTQVVIPSRILASVTSTRLISVTDHRASASSHARQPLEHPELHATPSRRRISPATPVYFLYPESILFHVRFPTYDALPPRHPGQPSRLPLSTGARTPDSYRKVPSTSSARARAQHVVLGRVIRHSANPHQGAALAKSQAVRTRRSSLGGVPPSRTSSSA